MKQHRDCLILNADYSPIGIIDWQKALTWSFKYTHRHNHGIEIIEYYNDEYVTGVNSKFLVPAVAKTVKYFKLHKKYQIVFSRKNLFTRDNYRCQYCGNSFPHGSLTYDHVVPKSRFDNIRSATNWHNIVTACSKCNRKKGNKTPKEANMKLISKPEKPTFSVKYLPWYQHVLTIEGNKTNTQWHPYIASYTK